MALAPATSAAVAARLVDDPATDLDHVTGGFGDGHELVGGEAAQVPMLPPKQCLERDGPRGLEVDDGLELQPQLSPLRGPAQVVADDHDPHRLAVEFLVVQLDGVVGRGLGAIQGHVRVAHQAHRVGAGGPRDGDAEAAAHLDEHPVHLDGFLDGGQQSRGQGHRRVRSGTVGHQDRELVAAETRHGVPRPNVGAQPLGDGDEDRITRGMTQRVVDRLEVVEVEADHGDLPRVPGEGNGQARAEPPAIAETRERILDGEALERALHPGALVDEASLVAHDTRQARHHEHEHHGRGDDGRHRLDRAVTQLLRDGDEQRHQRHDPERGQAAIGDASVGRPSCALGRHRRVERRGAPQGVAQDPAEVQQAQRYRSP